MNRNHLIKAFLLLFAITLTNVSCRNKDEIPRVDFTLDLNDPQYSDLNYTGGQVIVDQYQILVGKGFNGYFAVTSFCTFHNCDLQYQASYDVLQCPCSSCQFSTSGEVLMAPATNPLIQYATQLNGQWLRVYSP